MVTILWFVGLVGLVVAAAIAASRERATPDAFVARGTAAVAALAYAALVATGVWVWGGTAAREGRAARLAEGAAVSIAVVEPGILPRAGAQRRLVRAGEALAIGRGAALPGVTTWQVVLPHVAQTMLVVPDDPTRCETWALDAARVRAIAGGCLVDLGAFTLETRTLVPDPALVIARSGAAAFVIGAPAFVLLATIAVLARRRRRVFVLGAALRLAVLGSALAAIACWRLFWAYRIDMLRDLSADGTRVGANELACIGIAAALAGCASGVVRAPMRARVLATASAVVGWWCIAWFVVAPAAEVDVRVVGTFAIAALAALAPLALVVVKPLAARCPPEAALVAIALAAVAARAAAPRTTMGKLVLAYALVLAGFAALRLAVARGTPIARRLALAGLLAVAAVALATYDAGVTVAIAGTGLGIAMLVAGHDATYSAAQTAQLGLLEREHARLVLVHAGATIALTLGVLGWVSLVDDRALLARGATAVLHAPLALAGVFGLGAAVAAGHRRSWAPWLAAALAALAIWGARDRILAEMTDGDHAGARRIAALVEPGYALLSDDRSFASNVSAWREAMLPGGASLGVWSGQGAFGARIRDPGVARSIENDYLPVLVAREGGVGGLAAGIALLLALVAGAGVIAALRLPHGSRELRTRWVVLGVAGTLAVYQPLAALGVVPLTGISWPGLGIDSPADLWLLVVGALWCLAGLGDAPRGDDERVRQTPRLVRAHRLALVALGLAGITASAIVIRAGTTAVSRGVDEDARIAAALDYVETLACPAPERTGATLAEVIPEALEARPTDAATGRFDARMREHWTTERARLTPEVIASCRATGDWRASRDDARCTMRLALGWPVVELAFTRTEARYTARCTIERDDRAKILLRAPRPSAPMPRIRVVATPLGPAASDVGELVTPAGLVRIRAGARIPLDETTALEATAQGVTLRGPAELFVAAPAWRRLRHGGEVVLDRVTLIAVGPPARRALAVFRPGRELLLADTTRVLGERPRRYYPYGSTLPELGWVNPSDVAHSLGLDGWIHAAQRTPADASASCGTLAPPAIDRMKVCAPSALDGVLECRVTLQPGLAVALDAIADKLLAGSEQVTPVRVAYAVLRGDTGELLAQGNTVAGRPALAYAPTSPAAEAELVRLREARGESDRERVEWNQPIAVGSTLKPIFARAAERAFPGYAATLSLAAVGEAKGCKARRGKRVSPILGHCPPTTVGGATTTADLHDFLARSPNWYQATLGLVGLGLPDGRLYAGDLEVSLGDVIGSDLSAWPTERALRIVDGAGPILSSRGLSVAGLRRTPLWQNVEQLLGRPLCTLGDRASCERAADRRDVCAARALPIARPSADLRYLVALGPDRIDPYADDREDQAYLPVREYLQLLRGAGVHPIGSLLQLADAFNRVIYDPSTGPSRLAASWFPAPSVGTTPAWSCAAGAGHLPTVHGADGGLCGVLRTGGTASAIAPALFGIRGVTVYGAKTGTIDSLADIARKPSACKAWNARHVPRARLVCGKTPPDDSLFVVSFGVTTAAGTIPLTLAVQLQRGGASSAARATPAFVAAIADYLL